MNINIRPIASAVAAASLLTMLASSGAQAAMAPSIQSNTPHIQRVDCAAGFHIGPVGTCIIGVDDEHHDAVEEHHDTVIEKRVTDDGCQTKSVRRTDDMGNSETHTKTNCD